MTPYQQQRQPKAGLSGLGSQIRHWVSNALSIGQKNDKPKAINKPRGRVSQKLTRLYTYKTAMQVDRLNRAIDAAQNPTNPDRTALISLYDQAVKDAHLAGIIRNRNSIITGQPFFLCRKSDKEIDLQTTELLERPWFIDFLEYAAEAVLYGHSLIEFGDLKPSKSKLVSYEFAEVLLIPREFVIPEKRMIRMRPGDLTGPQYDQPPFSDWLLEVGRSHSLGLLQSATKQVIFKMFAEIDWASRSERFGLPLIYVKTSETRTSELAAKEDMAANIGRNGYVILDIADEVGFLEATSSGGNPAQLYERRIALVESALSILILGQTMTTKDGSSQSQANVHERVLYELIEADMRSLEKYINFTLLPFLAAKGYPVEDHHFIFKRFYREYKDPKAIPDSSGQGEPGPQGPNDGAKPSSKPKPADQEDEDELGFNLPLQLSSWGGEHLHSTCSHEPITLGTVKDINPKIKKAWAELIKRTFSSAPPKVEDPKADQDKPNPDYLTDQEVSQAFHQATYEALYEDFQTNFKSGFEAQAPLQPQVIAQANLMQFSGAKSLAALSTLRQGLYDTEGAIVPWEKFRNLAISLNKDYNINYLAAERQACIGTGIMSAQWQRLQAAKKVYPFLRYKAIMDNRTRAEHAALNGLVRNIDDPVWLTIYPPKAFNCRCAVEPLMTATPTSDERVNSAITSAKIHPTFKVTTMGQVFSDETSYHAKANDKALNANTAWLLKQNKYQIIPGAKGNFAAVHPQVIEQAKASNAEGAKFSREKGAMKAITNSGRTLLALPESKGPSANGLKNPDLLMLDSFTKAEIKNLIDAISPSRAIKEHLRSARKQGTMEVFITLRTEEDIADAVDGYRRYVGAPENKANTFQGGNCVFLVDGRVVWKSL